MDSKENGEVSAVIVLLRFCCRHAKFHRNSDFTCFKRDFIYMAIRVGFEFDPDDFKRIEKENLGYPSCDFEYFYSLACSEPHPNISACRALENYKKRPPYFIKDLTKRGRRIAVGTWFRWEGKEVKCTSFSPDGTFLRACAYKKWNGKTERLDRVFNITLKELKEAFKPR